MPTDTIRQDIERRARGALIAYAFFRWESAILIAATVLLALFYPQPFPWWRWYYWVALGVVAEALIVITSLTDAGTGQRVVEDMFEEAHDPRQIRTKEFRDQYLQARDYRRQMQAVVAQAEQGPLCDRLERASDDVAGWVGQIFELAQRLDRYVSDEVISRDRQAVPGELQQLETRVVAERDPQVRTELLRALEQKRAQRDNLAQLRNTMESARLRLDATLTALGTVYSQMLLVAAKQDEGAGAERLASDIKDQTAALQDVIESMDEVLKT